MNEMKNRGTEDILILSRWIKRLLWGDYSGLSTNNCTTAALSIKFEIAHAMSIRKMIYTTNSIENFNRQLRKVAKTKITLYWF